MNHYSVNVKSEGPNSKHSWNSKCQYFYMNLPNKKVFYYFINEHLR